MKQLTAILTALGFSKEKIESLTGLTDDQLKDWKPDDIVAEINNNIKTGLLNDDSFLASIPEDRINKDILKKYESGQYARFQNELIEVATKKLGLNDKEVLTDEDRKSIKKMTEKIALAYLNKNSNNEGVQKLQSELSALQEKLETAESGFNEKLTTEISKATSSASERLLKTIARAELSSLDKVKLNVSPAYIIDPVISKLKNKFDADLVLAEDDSIVLKQAKNKALDVLDAHKKPLSFASALRQVVLEEKLGTEVTEEPDDPKKKKIIVNSNPEGGNGDEPVVADYILEKINANGDAGSGG